MTTSRIVRGTKARIFICLSAVLIMTGIIACYHNTLSQLDDSRKSNDICHQQEENLSTQLQVISDYKQRLEKSLKAEKAERQQEKIDLENKFNEERSKHEKATNEANLRFTSLQQHYNLLKTQCDDFKEESSKTQSKQAIEINDLQAKLKEVQEELKKVNNSKETLKSEYLQAKVDEDNLRSELQQYKRNNNDDLRNEINHLTKSNHELQQEINELKAKCSNFESLQAPNIQQESSARTISNTSKKEVESLQIDAQNQVIQNPLNQNYIKRPTKSTTTSSAKISQARLDAARPLGVPTVTPKGANIVSKPVGKKLPEGVVPVPEKREVERKTDEQNELPDETVNNRYQNKIEDTGAKETDKKVDDADKENVAHEVFDPPHLAYDTLGFGEGNDPGKNPEKQHVNKQHIDNLGIGDKEANKIYENDYKDNQNDMQVEENDPEDDDPDDYGEHLGRLKDPIVRN